MADELVNPAPDGFDGLAVLAEEGWGAMVLPPRALSGDVAAPLLEQIAEQAAEFARNGYRLALVGERDGLERALAALGIALPATIHPTSPEELCAFLRRTKPATSAGVSGDARRIGPVIDLRSDTATQPTAGMREAIAAAVVGDEQRGEDPTTNALEERVAELVGHEAALFLPTATMANQIALRLLSEPGDEVIADADAHLFRWEVGGPAVHSGLAMKAIVGKRGLFGPDELRAAVRRPEIHAPRSRILCLENTHNVGGGRAWPVALVREVAGEARALGVSVHLDGARLLNASVASERAPAEYGVECDTVTLCLSKGLGCPLGALLAGSAERMGKARRLKHLFGGAMRQSGVVAAAGVYALDHHVERLADDHANARRLADGLATAGLPVDPQQVETNFVLLDAGALGLTVEEAMARLDAEGVRFSRAGLRGWLRAVTHLGVSGDDVERAIDAAVRALAPAAIAS